MLIFQFTLPREERRQVQAQPLTLQNFNPRSHERSDHITQSFVFRFFNFNPRSHERSDHNGGRLLVNYLYFNPRSHERSDDGGYSKPKDTSISIHAPTRGATSTTSVLVPSLYSFQSTLPREERRNIYCI